MTAKILAFADAVERRAQRVASIAHVGDPALGTAEEWRESAIEHLEEALRGGGDDLFVSRAALSAVLLHLRALEQQFGEAS